MNTKRIEEPAETSTGNVKGYVSAVLLRQAYQGKIVSASTDSVNPDDLAGYLQALRMEREAERILNERSSR